MLDSTNPRLNISAESGVLTAVSEIPTYSNAEVAGKACYLFYFIFRILICFI